MKSVFWLVSAKILKDKEVAEFSNLDLRNVEASFAALANHYGTDTIPISSEAKRIALNSAAKDIAQFANLSLTTTECLAHVYENTLISMKINISL